MDLKKQLYRIQFLILSLHPLATNSSEKAFSPPVIISENPQEQSDIVHNSKLKILSWNVYMLPVLGFLHDNRQRANIIADSLMHSEYHIVVLQEAFSRQSRKILSEKLKKVFPYQYGPANGNASPFKTSSGLWVLSRFPLKEMKEIRFSVSRGFDSYARKGAVLFEGRYHGHEFQLLATHLQAFEGSNLRNRQCQEIREKLLDPFFRSPVPQFLCGDFNTDMDDKINYQRMLQTLDAENGELKGMVRATYDEVGNNLAKVPEGKKRIIDYILVRNSSRIRNIQRSIQTFFAQGKSYCSHLSDHYALDFTVEL